MSLCVGNEADRQWKRNSEANKNENHVGGYVIRALFPPEVSSGLFAYNNPDPYAFRNWVHMGNSHFRKETDR